MQTVKVYFLIITFGTISNCLNVFGPDIPEDAKLNFTGLAKKYGHPAEQHEVITEDGYILTIFRMPGSKKTPILIVHGTGDHADSFVVRGNKSLGITLANADYDVWFSNNRGNRYSRRHTKLNPDTDNEYWNFGFHERGYYDLAETIDYVLNATGETSLITIGHSQGTSNHFVLLPTRPEYNDKIKLYIALAPVAVINHVSPRIKGLLSIGPLLNELAKDIRLEHLPTEKLKWPNFNELKCGLDPNDLPVCALLTIFYLFSIDPKSIEPEFFQVLVGHYPDPTTRKNLVHYSQIAQSRNFTQYDHGPEENLKRYGSVIPPEYDLRKITTKTALLLGRQDELATIKDAELLKSLLPNLVLYKILKPKNWMHTDFLFRNNMDIYLFPIILELLEKYS